MPTKGGFLFHLIRIPLTVILLAGISTDLISPPTNESFIIIIIICTFQWFGCEFQPLVLLVYSDMTQRQKGPSLFWSDPDKPQGLWYHPRNILKCPVMLFGHNVPLRRAQHCSEDEPWRESPPVSDKGFNTPCQNPISVSDLGDSFNLLFSSCFLLFHVINIFPPPNSCCALFGNQGGTSPRGTNQPGLSISSSTGRALGAPAGSAAPVLQLQLCWECLSWNRAEGAELGVLQEKPRTPKPVKLHKLDDA